MELKKNAFLELFYTIDPFQSSEIAIKPLKDPSSGFYNTYEITFTPTNEEGEKLVKQSFESLTLKKQGWHRKFLAVKKLPYYESDILSHQDVTDLIKHLYALDSVRGAKVEIKQVPHEEYVTFQVTITPLNDTWLDTLQSSFKDGLLHHWGWDKKFTLVQ